MTSRIFSINLDDVTFAKLEELKKSYPEFSRNGMIRHIINLVHSLEDRHQIEADRKFRKSAQGFMEWVDPEGDRREKWYSQSDKRRNSE